MENQMNHSGVLLEMENKTLWDFIEVVMPFLEKDKDYISLCMERPFSHATHRHIEAVLRQKIHNKKMESYSTNLNYRNNSRYEVCEICHPEEKNPCAPFSKRICPEHLKECREDK